jgi:hypothetical protein
MFTAIGTAASAKTSMTDHAAYADDIAVATVKRSVVEHISNALLLNEACSGEEVNVLKSAVTRIALNRNGSGRTCTNPKLIYGLKLRKIEFASLKPKQTYQYLGTEAAGKCDSALTAARITEIITKFGGLLHGAILPRAMKRFLYVNFVLPKVMYSLQSCTLKPSELDALDLTNRRTIKGLEQLNLSFNTASLHAPSVRGGLQYPCLSASAEIEFAATWLRRITAADPKIRSLEMSRLLEEWNRLRPINDRARIPASSISALSCSDFLELMEGSSPRDIEVVVRAGAALRLVLLGWKDGDLYAQVENEDSAFDTSKARALLTASSHTKFMVKWANMALEGEAAEAVSATSCAPDRCQCPHLTSISVVSDFQRTFAIKAQSNNINCETNQVRWKFSTNSVCQSCNTGQQGSTSHVLNNCQPRLYLYKMRHDAALNAIVKELAKIKGMQILVDSTPHIEVNTRGTARRPDIIMVKGNRVAILDVKCPFPSRAREGKSFDERCDSANREKYKLIKKDYDAKYGASNVFLGTLIIPSVGPTPALSFTALQSAGLSSADALHALRKMTTAAIRSNASLAMSLPPQIREPHVGDIQ